VVALSFDFLNGLHDAANSIATVVSTRVLRPHYAVGWAAFFNFVAFLFFGIHVARTIGTGIAAAEVVDAAVFFGALMGAICWNLITWWLGLPSSSSHALIGGLAGACVMKAGTGAIVWSGFDNRRRNRFIPTACLLPSRCCWCSWWHGLSCVRRQSRYSGACSLHQQRSIP
jgi:phosphate/sulfate permease